MRTIKSIIAILVVSCTMIACQTNDDLLTLESSDSQQSQLLHAKNPVSERAPSDDTVPSLGTSLLVVHDHLLDHRVKHLLRQAFIREGMVIIQVDECEDDTKETWTVTLMTYQEVQVIYTRVVNQGSLGRTVVVGEEDGSGPKPGAAFRMFFDGDCDSQI
jgi:hypothetical protein